MFIDSCLYYHYQSWIFLIWCCLPCVLTFAMNTVYDAQIKPTMSIHNCVLPHLPACYIINVNDLFLLFMACHNSNPPHIRDVMVLLFIYWFFYIMIPILKPWVVADNVFFFLTTMLKSGIYSKWPAKITLTKLLKHSFTIQKQMHYLAINMSYTKMLLW